MVFPGALPDTDLVIGSSRGGTRDAGRLPLSFVEFGLLLERKPARAQWAFAIERSADFKTAWRESSGAIVFGPSHEDARLRIRQPFIIDSAGITHPVAMWLAEDTLQLEADLREVVFPALLDPAIESAAWVERAPFYIRSGNCAAFDSARGVTIDFGGLGFQLGNITLQDTAVWDGTSWTELWPATSPHPSGCALAYDDVRHRAVLYQQGGTSLGNARESETWEWSGLNWELRSFNALPAYQGPAMAFDAARSETLLTCGAKAGSWAADTWVWDGYTWTQRLPVHSPPPRGYPSLAYDPLRQRVVLFGGENANGMGGGGRMNDTWEWDGTDWTQSFPTASPSPRFASAMTYDSIQQKVVLFGGSADSSTGAFDNDETWEWDGTNWVQQAPAHKPPPRSQAGAATDTPRGRVVLYGGDHNGISGGDTWEWDGTDWHPRTLTPAPDLLLAGDYDPVRRQFVILGTHNLFPNPPPTETWTWNGTVWTMLAPAHSPPPQTSALMAYDPIRDRSVMFGLLGSVASTWEWDGTDWSEVNTTSIPSIATGVYSASMAFDPASHRTLLFRSTGSYNNPVAETWLFDGGDWEHASPIHSYQPTASNPYVAALATSPADNSVILPMDGTWAWTGTDWSPLDAGIPGSAFGADFSTITGRPIVTNGVGVWLWSAQGWIALPQSSLTPEGSAFAYPPGRAVAYDGERHRLMYAMGVTTYANPSAQIWEFHTRGAPCTTAATCETGFCVDGVCCESSCGGGDPGDCLSCNDPNNPTMTGICSPAFDGNSCDDHRSCTSNDRCVGGVCAGSINNCSCAASVDCGPTQPCQAPACDGGACSNITLPDGTPCDDGNACTQGDTCFAGTCAGAAISCAVQNAPFTQCWDAGVCNPTTGECSYPWLPDGTTCDAGDPCVIAPACLSGYCRGTFQTCSDNLCVFSQCNSQTGACDFISFLDGRGCTEPATCTAGFCQTGTCDAGSISSCPTPAQCHAYACDGDGGCADIPLDAGACDDGDPCTEADRCVNASCVGSSKICPSNECNTGACRSDGGSCYFVPLDGQLCDGGMCRAGTCSQDAGVFTDAGTPDGGATDGGPVDAGPGDGGNPDAGSATPDGGAGGGGHGGCGCSSAGSETFAWVLGWLILRLGCAVRRRRPIAA